MGMADILGLSDQPWEGNSGGSLAQVVNPASQQASAPVVATPPEVVNERKGAWEAILSNIQKDQNLQSMLMHAGAMLMQPMGQNQTTAGRFGQVVANSSDYLANIRAQEAKQLMLQQKHQADLEQTAAQTDSTRARTARTEQEMEQSDALFPETKAKLAQDLANAKTDARRKEALANIEEFNARPENVAKRFKLDVEDKEAGIGQKRAAAASSSMHTALSAEQLRAQSMKNAIDEGATLSMTDEEIKALGMERLRGRGTAKNTLMENLDAYKTMFTKSSEGKRKEGESDADYEQRVTDYALGAVKKTTADPKLTAAYKVMESFDASDKDKAAARAYVMAALGQGSGKEAATPKAAKPVATYPEAAWAKARNSVEPGQTYRGPDGNTYTRK